MKQRTVISVLALMLAVAGVAAASPEAATPLGLYAQMHATMAADSAEGVAQAAMDLAELVRAEAKGAKDSAAYEALAAAAETMQGSDLAALRERFKEVSKAFAGYVNASGTDGAQLYYCPMADGYWVQSAADAGPENPYYGRSMLKCGSKVVAVEG